jgi:hypothetical protein
MSIARWFGIVSKSDLKKIEKRLLGEVEQQKRYAEAAKKRAGTYKAWSEMWQTENQAVANFTGRTWGLEIGIADIRDLLR